MDLSINNGATWTPTAITDTDSSKYTALNNVSMDGGNIDVEQGVSITLERVSGNGNIDNNGNIILNSADLTVNTLTTSDGSNLSLTEAGSSLTIANTSLEGLATNSLSNAAGSEIIFSNLDASTSLDAIKSLFSTDNQGNINVGNLEFTEINDKIVDGNISYEDWQAVGNVTSNELKAATVTDVPFDGTHITGSAVSSIILKDTEDKETYPILENVILTGLGSGDNFVTNSDGSLGGAYNYGTIVLGDKELTGTKNIGYIGFGGNNNLLIAKGQDKTTATIVTGRIQGNANATHNIQAKNITLKTQAIGSSEEGSQNSFNIEATSANIEASGEVYANNVSLIDASALTSETDITVNGALSGTGTVQAAEKLELTQAYTGENADALHLSGANVTTVDLNSQHGTIEINADDVLTTTGPVVLAGDTITAKKWDPSDTITASNSVLQAGQFGTGDSSTLDQALTLNNSTLFVHGDANLDDVRAAIADTGHQGTTYYTDKTLNLSAADPNAGTTAGTLTVGDVASAGSNTVALGADSLLVIDSKALDGKEAFTYAQPGGSGGTASIEDGASLHAVNVLHGQNVTIFGEGFGEVTGTWENVSTDTPMLKAELSLDNKELTVTAGNAREVYPDLSDEMASLVDQYYRGKYNEVSDIAGREFLRRATNSDLYLADDRKLAAATIESATRIAFAGAVPQMTKMASDAATNAVVNRLGFANPDNGAKAMNVDGKLVDDKALGLALWIAPLWSNQTGFGMEAGNLDYGYNANLGGISLGADYTWANNFRAGLMFNIGGGYAESAGGDLSETTNSMTFWGVGAYGGWKYENFAVMGDVSYTSTWNSVDQDVDHRMEMGDLEADIQASAISAGLRFEYKLETQYLDLIPHVGARYMSINTWGYDVDSANGTILEGDGFQQNIWTFPVGITFSKELEMKNDWYIKPSVDFTVIPAAGDIKAKEDVRFTGLPYSTEIETQMMDYFTWQGGVGLEFGNDNMSVGVNYTLQAGQNSTGHGVFGMFRYEF